MIGVLDDKKTRLEEIKVDHSDIMALEGTIRGNKIRIILTYFDSTKKHIRNRLQKDRKKSKDNRETHGS